MNESKKLKSFVKYCSNGNIEEVKRMLSSGEIDLNHYWTSHFNLPPDFAPLNAACEKGNYEIVELLINSGAPVNGLDEYLQRPLYYAVRRKHVRIVKLLLEKGAFLQWKVNKEMFDDSIWEDFNASCDKETLYTMVKLLLDHKTIPLEPLFILAVVREDVPLLKLVISEGANVKLGNMSNLLNAGVPTLVGASKISNAEIKEILIISGVDRSSLDSSYYHQLLFHHAVQYRFLNIVKLLLKKGVYTDQDTENLLLYLCRDSFNFDTKALEILKLLLDKKIIFSMEPFFLHAVKRCEDIRLLRFAIDQGVDVNLRFTTNNSYNGQTALWISLNQSMFRINPNRQLKFVEILLKSGANPNMKCFNKCPLMVCSNINLLNLLLKFGADINGRDEEGNTALHGCKWTKSMTFLISRGIDTNIRNHKNQSAQEVFEDSQIYNSYENMADHYEKCMREISLMKNITLNNYGLTLHDILLMNIHDLTRYVNNVNLKNILHSKIIKQYPIMGYRLKKKIVKGFGRKKLLNSASQCLQTLTGLQIPELVLSTLFKYFSGAEIKDIFLVNLKK